MILWDWEEQHAQFIMLRSIEMFKFAVLLFTFSVLFTQYVCQEIDPVPKIITREEWNARVPSEPPQSLRVNPPSFIVIHHSYTGRCHSESTCKKMVKSFQNYHMDNNHWDDIGYNFLVGGDGNVYEGRGWGIRGAHSPKYNAKSLGICFIGNFTSELPETLALEAAKQLLAHGVSIGNIENDYTLIGHRQGSKTECPGNKLYELIETWPHWGDV